MDKSNALIRSLEDEDKCLPDGMHFLWREGQELVKSKKNLESKCVRLDKDLCEWNDLSNRHPQPNETFDRMFSVGLRVGDNRELGNTNERTHTSSKAMFVKCVTNPSPRQVGTRSKFFKNRNGGNTKKNVANETEIPGACLARIVGGAHNRSRPR
ncbi:unnamed protein product [Ilex paraguariensis]|uniref:Uncharacterized protein n=1 Tax=Ilex paraguariensis TaxID=185542 RepID=A0ABC8RBB7_9AQUA